MKRLIALILVLFPLTGAILHAQAGRPITVVETGEAFRDLQDAATPSGNSVAASV